MESHAYEYATDKLCYPKNEMNERISLSKVFDMVAGTSTGSLLATAIVIPAVDDPTTNRYYSDDAIKIYTTRGAEVFKKYILAWWIYVLGIVFNSILGGLIGYWIGKRMYTNESHERVMKELKKLIKLRKNKVNKNIAAQVDHSD